MTTTETAPYASTRAELQRINFSGTIWFAATLLGAAVPLAGLLASGWRPSDLVDPAAVAWWLGVAMIALGIACLAWAGCPVVGGPAEQDDRVKSVSIRTGLLLFAAGSIASLIAVLIG